MDNQIDISEIQGELTALKKQMEDIEFAIRTELAWREIEEGKFTEYDSPEEFFESLKNDD